MANKKRSACVKVMTYMDLKYNNIGEVAEAIGLHRGAGYRWVRDNDGRIPERHHDAIIKLAKKHKIKLYKTDLIGD